MKTTLDTEREHTTMPWQKWVADLLTLARAPLALALVWVGSAQGKDGIQSAFILLLIAATIDTLDGYFARLSHYPFQTWVGARDLIFDLSFSVALLLYLAVAGYISPYLAAVYGGVWAWIFYGRGAIASTLAVLFQAPLYAGVGIAAMLDSPSIIWWTAIWLGLMLAFAGRRFFHVRLPEFLQDLVEKTPIGTRWSGPRDSAADRGAARRGKRDPN